MIENQNQETEKPLIANVRNPNLWPEPNTIKNQQLLKYISMDEIKLQHSYLNYKRSGKYIGGILAGCLVAKFFVDYSVNKFIFGSNGNGGDFLKMYTKNTNEDYYYNREFQRMRYLSDEAVGDDPSINTRDEMLVDLGINLGAPGGLNTSVNKRAPHFKYF